MAKNVFREATLTPDAVEAGNSYEIIIRLVAGEAYADGPTRLVVDFPTPLGTSKPSLYHAEDPGYVEARVSNPDVSYTKRLWSPERREFMETGVRMFVLDISGGVRAGDVIEVIWGFRREGFGQGAKVPTVVPRLAFALPIEARYFSDPDAGLPDEARDYEGYRRPAPEASVSLPLRILPRAPHHLRLYRRPAGAALAVCDLYSNISDASDAGQVVEAPEPPRGRNDFGVFEYANKAIRVRTRGLPMTETPPMENAFEGLNIYWGDVHTHSAYSSDVITRSGSDMAPDRLVPFARQRAQLDFHAVTDHHQPWDHERQKVGRKRWERTMKAVERHNAEGEFLALAGYEYRCPRGDTAVVYGWLPTYDEIDRPEWSDVRKLWEGLAGQDILTIPHFHNGGKLDEGEWWVGPEGVEPVLEIFSCHGSYERPDALERLPALCKSRRPDRYGDWLLRKGLRYGLAANSDGHKGHVGFNGVTAVFAEALTKDAIFQAYRKRHVYGTTNARMRLVFTGNGALMGSVVPNERRKTLRTDVVGESPLKRVDLFRNAEPYRVLRPDGIAFREETVVEDEEPSFWYVRVTQLDDHIAWSSPIWFE